MTTQTNNGKSNSNRRSFQVLFATHVSARAIRPVQTVTPLVAALHLPIDDSFSNDDYADLRRHC